MTRLFPEFYKGYTKDIQIYLQRYTTSSYKGKKIFDDDDDDDDDEKK